MFFINWEKLRSPARAAFKKPKICLQIGKGVEVQHKANTQKFSTLNLWMNWKTKFKFHC